MSSRPLIRVIRGITVACATVLVATPALAVLESSCPAPCLKPPKSVLFVREDGAINGFGYATSLHGTLRKGTAKTVLRLDVSATLQLSPNPIGRFLVDASVNGIDASPVLNLQGNACDNTQSIFCSVVGTFWWDIDALEAAHPGMFVGQPLKITVVAGNLFGGGGTGDPYVMSFSAQVVKNK